MNLIIGNRELWWLRYIMNVISKLNNTQNDLLVKYYTLNFSSLQIFNGNASLIYFYALATDF